MTKVQQIIKVKKNKVGNLTLVLHWKTRYGAKYWNTLDELLNQQQQQQKNHMKYNTKSLGNQSRN